MVFCRGDEEIVSTVTGTLKQFGEYSGLLMNMGKSKMYLGGVNDHVKETLYRISGMAEGSLLVRYLGVPLHQHNEYSPLVQKIQNRICSWAHRKLSHAGRVVLILSVIESIVRFWANIFHFPSGLMQKLVSTCRTFLWTCANDGGNRARVAWEAVCQPQVNGGLGIKELLSWNRANMFHLVCELSNAESTSVWKAFIQAYRLHNHSIWSIEGKPSGPTWWRNLLAIRDMV